MCRNNSRYPPVRAVGTCLTLSLTSVFLLLVYCVGAQGCTPPEGPMLSLVEKVHHSDVVWQGRVLRTFPDNSYNYGEVSSVYTAEMQIHCIIKGRKVPKIANITHVGVVPGYCHSSSLEVGKDYVVLLDKRFGDYQISDAEVRPTTANLNKVFSACGIQPKYPSGVAGNTAEVRCHAKVTPCVADEHSNNRTTLSLPPGHSKNDGHDHSKHYPGDGHEHGDHFPGDGHNHGDHYPGDGHNHGDHYPGDGHKHGDHYPGDGHNHGDHYPGDGHKHGDHYPGDGHKHGDHYPGDGHDHGDHYPGDGHDHDKDDVEPSNVKSKGVATCRYSVVTLSAAAMSLCLVILH